jgi:hypothetical protein
MDSPSEYTYTCFYEFLQGGRMFFRAHRPAKTVGSASVTEPAEVRFCPPRISVFIYPELFTNSLFPVNSGYAKKTGCKAVFLNSFVYQ